jgi:NAD(P)-dependent dehydrogenase (short-subunit alcohol dehydrogenase family)
MKLKDRVAIITGGGSGIGEATARLLAKEGAAVGILDVNDEGGLRVTRSIEDGGGRAMFVHCDVTQEAQVAGGIEAVVKAYGRLDIIHNNAGVSGPSQVPIDQLEESDWNRVLNTHLKGCFLCSKHAVRQFKKQGGGVIVNTASTAGLVGLPMVHAYGAAKHGIVGLTKEMALELAPFGIRVAAVAPGAIDTPMLRHGAPALGAEQLQSIHDRHPLGHPGEPDDIAHGVLYLVSDDAKFVTGTVLSIDGGYIAR